MTAAGTPWAQPAWAEDVTYDSRPGVAPEGVRLVADVSTLACVMPRADVGDELDVALEQYVPLVDDHGVLYVDDGGDPLAVLITDCFSADVRVLPDQARALAAALIVAADRADAITRSPQEPADGRERP
ncbi:hypothetical protein [Cellulosimicrobium sp. RS]|uniref:hypothetical protein n=1 Tax=Cellulosimicrobium sp. RS TaxID=3381347 RepID=UPI0038FC4440